MPLLRESDGGSLVGSGRGRYWQRPLPIIAAGGEIIGSDRCQPISLLAKHSLVSTVEAALKEEMDSAPFLGGLPHLLYFQYFFYCCHIFFV